MRICLVILALIVMFSTPAAAQVEEQVCAFGYCGPSDCIYVRSNGHVAKNHFTCEAICDSLNIDEVCYDSANEYLVVHYDRAYIQYCGVEEDLVNSFINASEKEKFYNRFFRRQFNCAATPPPEYEDSCEQQ